MSFKETCWAREWFVLTKYGLNGFILPATVNKFDWENFPLHGWVIYLLGSTRWKTNKHLQVAGSPSHLKPGEVASLSWTINSQGPHWWETPRSLHSDIVPLLTTPWRPSLQGFITYLFNMWSNTSPTYSPPKHWFFISCTQHKATWSTLKQGPS